MNKRPLVLGLMSIFGLVFITACQGGTSSDGGDTQIPKLIVTSQQNGASINLAALADLDQTTSIDVLRREDGDDCTSANCVDLFTITDTETINSLVQALDRDLYLRPRDQCPALYLLVFHLTDGRQHEIGYACEMASPSFLRGGQVFWQGQDVIAPDSFNRVISAYLTEDGNLETSFQE